MNKVALIIIISLSLALVGLSTAWLLTTINRPAIAPPKEGSEPQHVSRPKAQPTSSTPAPVTTAASVPSAPREIFSFLSPIPKAQGDTSSWVAAQCEFEIPANGKQFAVVVEAVDLTGRAAPNMAMHGMPRTTTATINIHEWKGNQQGWVIATLLGPVVSPKAGLQAFVYWPVRAGKYSAMIMWTSPWAVKVFEMDTRLPESQLTQNFFPSEYISKWNDGYESFNQVAEDNFKKRQMRELWEDYQERQRIMNELRNRGR